MNLDKKQKFAIRKLTIGVCSVLFGILMTTPAVLAEGTVTDTENGNTAVAGNDVSATGTPAPEAAPVASDETAAPAAPVVGTDRAVGDTVPAVPAPEEGQQPKNPTSQGYISNANTREVAETTPWRDSFDKGDFDGAVEKAAERDHVIGFYPQKGEPSVARNEEIGSVRYKWKEKEFTAGEGYDGWTLKSGDSFNVVQPETPEYINQNMDRYQRRKVTGDNGEISYVFDKLDPYVLGDKDKSKVYDIPKDAVAGAVDGITGDGYLLKGTPKPASTAAESASIGTVNYYRSATSTRFVELKNQGTEIQSSLYAVNPNSTIRFHFSYKGAFDGWNPRTGQGEQGIGYLVDQDGNVLTTADGKTKEIVNLGAGVFGYSEAGAFYKIPENVTGVRMVLKAGEKSKLYPNHQDAGYIFDNVGLELGAALNHKQILTKIPKEGANVTGEGTYGKDDVYTRGDKIQYVLNVKNEGGITAANVKTKIVVPEGVSLDGPLPAGYTYDEASRTITVPNTVYGASGDSAANGFQDYSAGPALAVMKSRDITLNFKIDDDTDKQGVFFKATTTYTNSTYTWSNGVSVRGSVTSQDGFTGPQQPLYIDTKAPVAPIVDSINTAAKIIPVDVTAAEKENTADYTDGGGIKLKLSVIDPASPDTPVFAVEATRDENGVWKLPNGTVVAKNAEGKLELPVPEGTKLKESELSIVATIQDRYENVSGEAKANITNEAPEFVVPTTDKPADPIEKGSTFTDDQIKNLVTNITDKEDDSDSADKKEIGAVTIVDKGGFDPNKVDDYTIKVSVTDSDGKTTEKTFVLKVQDTTAPKAPTVGTVDTAAKVVPVTPNDTDEKTIVVNFPTENGTEPVKITKDENGVWRLPDNTEVPIDGKTLQVPVPETAKLTEGKDKITAVAKDASGNTSEPGKGAVTNDAPTFDVPAEPTVIEKGTEFGEDKIKALVTNIKDKEDGTDSTDAKNVGEVVIKNDGDFDPNTVGKYTVTVTVTDSDGKTTEKTLVLEVKDTTAPKAPIVGTVDTAAKVVPVTPNDTDEKTIVVNFPTENGTEPVEITKDENGVWKLPNGTEVPVDGKALQVPVPETAKLAEGPDKITAVAKDASGNTSEPGKGAVTNEAPTFDVPAEPTVIEKGTEYGDDKIKALVTNITDKEDDSDKADKKAVGAVTIVDKGKFDPNKVGEYTIKVSVTDSDGKTTEKTFVLKVEDKTAPKAPTVGTVDTAATEVPVTPNDEDVTSITVNFPTEDGTTVPATVTKGEDGKWKDKDGKEVPVTENGEILVPVPESAKLVPGGDKITATATDASNNPSDEGKGEITNEKPVVTAKDQKAETDEPVDLTKDVVITDKEDDKSTEDTKMTEAPTYIIVKPDGTKVTLTEDEAKKFVPDQPGEHTVTIVTHDSDGEEGKTTVKLNVVTTAPKPNPTPDNEKFEPTPGEVVVPKGQEITEKDITDQVSIPEGSGGTAKVVGEIPTTEEAGDKGTVTVEITYPDGTKDTVKVPVKVTETPTPEKGKDADKYEPGVGTVTVPQGTPIKADDILGKVTIPEGSGGTAKVVGEIPTTEEAGDKGTVTVEITYPDGTKDRVEVPVKVTEVPNPTKDKDTDKYQPGVGTVTVPQGTPITEDTILGKVTIPEGSGGTAKVAGKIPSSETPGDKGTVTVVVTYPDGSTDTVEVPVKVTEVKVPEDKDTDKYQPGVGTVTVPQGTPIIEDTILSKVTIPEGSGGTAKVTGTIPSSETPGDKGTVTVVVTYPDGSTDTVEVPVKVTEVKVPEDKDTDKYQPGVGTVTVPQGTPITEDTILGKVTIPEGSGGTAKVVGKIPTTEEAGDKGTVKVVVTYPDGSTDTVEVPVKVTPIAPKETDADKHTPVVGRVSVPQGAPISEKDILAQVTIPEGSGGTAKVVGKIPTTEEAGDKGTVKVVVTYPDGSTDTVEVPVKVTPIASKETDADKHTPVVGRVSVPQGAPISEKDILAQVTIPEGSGGTA
ncbi:YSIRK-type signal peptide-containing protein, partial [Streptococcus sp. zg-86]